MWPGRDADFRRRRRGRCHVLSTARYGSPDFKVGELGIDKSAVIGAGACGSAIAHRLASSGLFADVVLADQTPGKAEGRALDIEHAGCIEGFLTRTTGVTVSDADDGYAAIAGCAVVVIAVGRPRRPGMLRVDLTEENLGMVHSAAVGLRRYASQAVVIVLTNPLDEMTAYVQAVSGLPARRVIGEAGVLDSARFRYLIAEELAVPVADVTALVLGPHSDEMVPVPSRCTVRGRPLRELLPARRIDALVARARCGGTEIIDLLRTGSTSIAPSSAVLTMVTAIVSGSRTELPVSTRPTGQYGISGVYLGAPAVLGRDGVESVIGYPLEPAELRALRASAELARERQARVIAMAPSAAGQAPARAQIARSRNAPSIAVGLIEEQAEGCARRLPHRR
jgi:malate dehydrogenase